MVMLIYLIESKDLFLANMFKRFEKQKKKAQRMLEISSVKSIKRKKELLYNTFERLFFYYRYLIFGDWNKKIKFNAVKIKYKVGE